MAVVNITNIAFYDAGVLQDGYTVVGYDWANHNRVVRYTFTAPETGGTSITGKFTYQQFNAGDKAPLAFFVGTDPESHKNAGADSPRAGLLLYGGSGADGFQGGAEIALAPGKTYYLWIFPSVAVYDCWVWQATAQYATIEVEGTSGGAYVGNDYYRATIGGEAYLPYIGGNNGEWNLQG